MAVQTLATHRWPTPRGGSVELAFRPDTNDWNVAESILHADEYQMPHRVSGVAIDVGAHIGAWAIGLAADNPELRVIALEPLPENAAMLQANVERNGLADRVVVRMRAAACAPEPVRIFYGDETTEFGREHRYIGNAEDPRYAAQRHVDVDPLSLSEIVDVEGPIATLKIDCEGCEWSFLDDPAVSAVLSIAGEYHPRGFDAPARLRELLGATHDVRLDDSEPFGLFWATRR